MPILPKSILNGCWSVWFRFVYYVTRKYHQISWSVLIEIANFLRKLPFPLKLCDLSGLEESGITHFPSSSMPAWRFRRTATTGKCWLATSYHSLSYSITNREWHVHIGHFNQQLDSILNDKHHCTVTAHDHTTIRIDFLELTQARPIHILVDTFVTRN